MTADVQTAEAESAEVVMSARNVAKSYGSIHALKGVNFDIHRGEVTPLFGENGAGKSTLMKILSGVVRPTSGAILLDGQPISFASPTDARNHGISIIHQELSLAPNLNLRDNIFMGREIMARSGVDFAEEERQTRALMAELEAQIDPLTPVEDLPLGQQQIVEIARALSVNSRILIMDEPTSALSATEVGVLFKVFRDLTGRGVSIVDISHHLEEAFQITNHAVVLRDGALTANAARRQIDLHWIVRNMVGESFDLGSPPTGYVLGEVALSIENLTVPGAAGLSVDNLSLSVRAGEIVCNYGLMGGGRTELLETVAGRLKASAGRVMLRGHDLSCLTIAQRIAKGVVLVPEDRQRDGLFQTMSVGNNLSLASIAAFTKRLFTSRRAEQSVITSAIKKVTIKTDPTGTAPIGSLSGGNQQKVVIGKMLTTDPSVILFDEPSRGIDLSVGSILGLSGCIAGYLMQGVTLQAFGVILYPPVWVVVILTCALGAFTGLVNGTLIAIAAVVIGGAALTGGRGTIRGTMLGAFVIGFLSDGLITIIVTDPANPYWKTEGDVAKATAESMGYTATLSAHKGDTNAESTMIDTAITNKSFAIILDPANADSSVGAVQKAVAAGIPVVLVNAEITKEGLAKAQLVSNNAQGAAMGATQWQLAVGDKAKYAELFGNPADNNAAARSNGYETGLTQYPDLAKVAKEVANWDRTQGHDKMQSMLQAHPEITGVIAGNDAMALGAIAALKEAGKLASVKVGGFDGSPDAVAAVKAGEMRYTVLQPVAVFSAQAIKEADSLLQTGKAGAATEKHLFDCLLITKDNIAKYTGPVHLVAIAQPGALSTAPPVLPTGPVQQSGGINRRGI